MDKIEQLYTGFAESIKEEILADERPWFLPRGSIDGLTKDFDNGHIKFINGNLNYSFYESMIVCALTNGYDWNKNFSKSLDFCNYLRPIIGEYGPFGRMCVWKLEQGGCLLPHVDNWPYHRNITRYIFCVSGESSSGAEIIVNSSQVEVTSGLLFRFSPATEIHEFINRGSENFYFLGFDFWNVDKLQQAAKLHGLTENSVITYEPGYGDNKKNKYLSGH